MSDARVFYFDKPKKGKMKVTFEIDLPEGCKAVFVNCHAQGNIQTEDQDGRLLERKELDLELIDSGEYKKIV